MDMTFSEYINYLSSKSESESSNHHLYLQQPAVAEMGQGMMEEYTKFSLAAALQFKLTGKWDAFSSNLLLVGPKGAITPCHFDEQENLFAQLYGQKRVRLFHPNSWKRLYPFPVNHACDRQTRVKLPLIPGQSNLDEDDEKYPAFSRYANDPTLMEYYTDLSPGELLYIPQYWFHQMEGLSINTSLSWWFKHQSKEFLNADGTLKLKSVSYISVRRNLEKLISQATGGGRNAHNFFLALAAGHIPIPRQFDASPSMTDFANKNSSNDDIDASGDMRQDENKHVHDYSYFDEFLSYDVEDYEARNITLPNEHACYQTVVLALQMLSLIVGSESAPAFLKELVSGRFNQL
jgi:hypothetical protein